MGASGSLRIVRLMYRVQVSVHAPALPNPTSRASLPVFTATTGGANLKKLARTVGPDLVSIAFCAAVFYYCSKYAPAS